MDLGQLYITETGGEANHAILPSESIVVALGRRGGRTQKRLGPTHVRQDDGSRTGMVAWGWVLLLIGVLVFLVDDDQA